VFYLHRYRPDSVVLYATQTATSSVNQQKLPASPYVLMRIPSRSGKGDWEAG